MTNTEIDELYRLTPDRFAFAQAIAELAISDALISVSHAVAEEREACKAACRSVAADWRKHGSMPVFEKAALACCDAIDERSNVKVSGPEAALSPEGRARLPGWAPATDKQEGVK